MTPDDFNAALATLGWSQRMLARRLGCDAMTVNRWSHGRQAIPAQVAAYLARLKAAHARVPEPAEWQA